MRVVTALSLFGAVANLLYSIYVVVIALFKTDVAPGWISFSLQQSGMFFLISLVLLVLGEYILNMASLSNEGPLYHVGQEFTSARMTRHEKLNIEEAQTLGVNGETQIIGGGFYGAAISIYLAKQRKLKRVLLLEQESSLLKRASYNNQARVHNGYHYPRSFTTAYRSRINLPKFVRDWPEAVKQDFTKLYAIARRNSKVTAKQFERFCREISATIQPADPTLRKLFEPRLIEDVFLVEEYAFDSTKLADWAKQELTECGVRVLTSTKAKAVLNGLGPTLSVQMERLGGDTEQISCRYVFNCTYSGLNQISGDFPMLRTELKQEITEMALMKMPPELEKVGITVMDGPFFSMMPFPARGLHTLSHVRYTPHMHWCDQRGLNPYEELRKYPLD
uniref:DAO domain-containing protein n=1 Tax=Steinernema glaseri TaxID=37863 RepID=A0A1I7ZKB1_9BILA